MRRHISLALIASMVASNAACAVPSDSAQSNAEPSSTTTEGRAPTNGAHASPGASLAADQTDHAALAGPAQVELAPIAVIAAAMTIYNAYKAIAGFLTSTTDPSVEILQELGDLKQQMQQLDTALQQLDQQLANLAYQDRRAYYLQTLQNVQTLEAQAQTASQQLTDYVQTGKTNALLLASADNNSQLAANTLKESSFYYRPAPTAGAPDIFDLRQVLVSYLYALTVRLSVVALEHPDFRNNSGYREEFQNHVDWLRQIPGLNASSIQHWSGGGVSTDNQFWACSQVTDTNSGYQSIIAGDYPSGYNPLCTPTEYGSQADATDKLQYLQWWDNWRVEDEMGVHTAQRMADLVTTDARAPITWNWPVPIGLGGGGPTYNALGPLVANDGRCLTLGSYGPSLATCSRGTSTQTWQTAGQTGTASIALQDGSACIEVPDWRPEFNVVPRACAGSPGEQFTVTAANEMRWQRDPSYCLTNASGGVELLACDGSSQQVWKRDWPIYIPIHIGL